MKRYITLLQSNSEISDYKITQTSTHSYQLFFVDNKLETNRVSDASSYSITIYVDVDNKRGNAEFKAFDYQSDKEILTNIKEAVNNAKLALNPHFDLPLPSQDKQVQLKSNLSERPFNEIAEDIANIIFDAAKNKQSYSAATEIFLYKENVRIVNSKGLDVQQEKYSGEIELIPTLDTPNKEVEVYHMIRFLDFNEEELRKEVEENLDLVEARFNAVSLPNLNVDVIIDGYELGQIFDYFIQDLNYASKYQKNNLFEIGDDVQKDGDGDKLTLKVVPYYPGASESTAFDDDGIILKDVLLVEKGIAKDRIGSNRFACYLGYKPNGVVPINVVEPGQITFKQMQKKPYVRCVRFSAMQMDHSSGLVGGEVRLGFYFDGEKEIPVTGFTVSGNMHKLRGNILYSKEEVTYSNYHGPKYLLFPGMKII